MARTRCIRTRPLLHVLVVLLVTLAGSAAVAGPVILGGDDLTEHGSAGLVAVGGSGVAVPEAEPNGASASANSVAIGEDVTASIGSPTDVDYVAFVASGGESIEARTVLGTLNDSTLTLYGPNGATILASNDDFSGRASRIAFTLPPGPGTYFLKVAAYSSCCEGTYTLQLRRTELQPMGGWVYIQRAVESLASLVRRPSAQGRVAALGSAASSATSGDAGAAIGLAAAGAGLAVDFYNGAAAIDAFFGSLASGQVNPAIIWLAGEEASNDLDSAEGAALVRNAPAIADFVNSGGGLMAHGSGPIAYGWLTTLLQGVQEVSGCDASGAMLTPDGIATFRGLANANIDATVGPCHSHFTGDLRGLTVLAEDGQGRPFIIGGALGVIGFELQSVLPAGGGNTGMVSATIRGGGFEEGATVKLTRTGQADIVGSPTGVKDGGLSIATTFDLEGRALGSWDVVVTNPNGQTRTLPSGFVVTSSGGADPWVQTLGRTTIRAGLPATFTIAYGNRGSVNAFGVPLWVGGIPADATWSLDFELTPPPTLDPADAVDWDQVPVDVESADGTLAVPLYVPLIPAGYVGNLRITISVPTERNVELRAWLNPAFFSSPMKDSLVDCAQQAIFRGLDLLIALIPGSDCIAEIRRRFVQEHVTAVEIGLQAWAKDQRAVVSSLVQFFVSHIKSTFVCLADVFPLSKVVKVARKLLSAAETVLQGKSLIELIEACSDAFAPTVDSILDVVVAAARDPNEKVGPPGVGDPRWIAADGPSSYAIFYENMPTAGLAAQTVTISDTLDPALFDLDTFSFGPVTIGSRDYTPPAGAKSVDTTVDLRPSQNLFVKVSATIDNPTGRVDWTLTAIDPATGDVPEDPTVGFLPPNVDPPSGEGQVQFVVTPRKSLPSGTVLPNSADIVFDFNPPIAAAWSNAIDKTAPQSRIDTVDDRTCALRWSGDDGDSGVRDFTIFVSEDGGPFVAWLDDTARTSAPFAGRPGGTYRFYSVARDRAGNVEAPPAVADVAPTSDCAAHDLAVTKIKMPRSLKLTRKSPTKSAKITVEVENRGKEIEVVADQAALNGLLILEVRSFGGGDCPDVVATARARKASSFPIRLKPAKKLKVAFDVVLGCSNDPLKETRKDPNHSDYAISARVDAEALGVADAHTDDDACPREAVLPAIAEPISTKPLRDQGCGVKVENRTFGGRLLLDVVGP